MLLAQHENVATTLDAIISSNLVGMGQNNAATYLAFHANVFRVSGPLHLNPATPQGLTIFGLLVNKTRSADMGKQIGNLNIKHNLDAVGQEDINCIVNKSYGTTS